MEVKQEARSEKLDGSMENRDVNLETLPAITAGYLLRTPTPVAPDEVLGKAAFLLRTAPMGGLPVVRGGMLVGWLDEAVLTAALAENPDDPRPVGELADPAGLAVAPHATLPELADAFRYADAAALPVVTPGSQYLGIVLRADVAAALGGRYGTPRQIGGMATPLGVYMTNGTVSGGAGWLGLMLTGVVLATTAWVSQLALTFVLAGAYHLLHMPLLKELAQFIDQDPAYLPLAAGPECLRELLGLVLVMLAFMLLFRFMPRMGGTHAAEHQTINALEAGEPLTPEAVARMPRVHPRCGTNLWSIGMLGYLSLTLVALVLSTPLGRAYLPIVGTIELWIVLAIVLTWRPFGAWLQQHITTRPASPREIASGIAAAREVQRRSLTQPDRPLTLARRVWSMGLVPVAVGFIVAGFVLPWLETPLDALWHSLVK